MSAEKKRVSAFLVAQCVVTAVILATVGVLRLLGGTMYEELKSGFCCLLEDNVLLDLGVQEITGEMDGDSEEVIP